MITALITIIIAFFVSAVLVGLYQGAKEGFGMTNEEAEKIIKEEQQRKEDQRLAQAELDRYLNELNNKLHADYEDEENEEDEEDEEDKEDKDIDKILYGDLDEALDDYYEYGIGQDPDEKHTFGGYINPELHERKEEREFNDWLKQQK